MRGARTHNHCVQATPDSALVFVVAQVSSAPDAARWAMKGELSSPCQPAFRFRALLFGLAFFCLAMFTSQADVSAPIHDWTLRVGNGAYGVTSWAPGHWDMYMGSRIEPGASVAVQYAVVLLLWFFSGIIACRFAILLLRTFAPRPRPNNAAAGKAGIAPRLTIGRHWPGLPEPTIVMPDNNSAPVQFRSCTSKVDVLEAVFCLIGAATSLLYPRGWMVALALALVAIWLCRRAHHDRSRPYVEVRNGRLTVHAGHRIIHDIDTSLLAGVGGRWNKTILILKDGRQLAINHTGFATGEEADRFRKFAKEALYVAPA